MLFVVPKEDNTIVLSFMPCLIKTPQRSLFAASGGGKGGRDGQGRHPAKGRATL
jgi:hypothetical protein